MIQELFDLSGKTALVTGATHGLGMAIAKGLDGAIVNPMDKKMMANIIAAEALAGKDDYCMAYLKAYRANLFVF